MAGASCSARGGQGQLRRKPLFANSPLLLHRHRTLPHTWCRQPDCTACNAPQTVCCSRVLEGLQRHKGGQGDEVCTVLWGQQTEHSKATVEEARCCLHNLSTVRLCVSELIR